MSTSPRIELAPDQEFVPLKHVPEALANALHAGAEKRSIKAEVKLLHSIEVHTEALKNAIRRGDLIPLNSERVPLEITVRESLELGQITVESFVNYAATLKVEVVRAKPTVDWFAKTYGSIAAERHPEWWADPNDSDPMRKTIAGLINANGWHHAGIPGYIDVVLEQFSAGTVELFSTINGLKCTDPSLVRTSPSNWYIGSGLQHLQEYAALSLRYQIQRAREVAQTERQRQAKEAAGRYTLEEAAQTIAKNTGENENDLKMRLITAVRQKRLRTFNPGSALPRIQETVHEFWEEAFWFDLNTWLEEVGFQNRWRFSSPQSGESSVNSSKQPMLRQPQQEEAVLQIIKDLGYQAMALPRPKRGAPGVKSEVRKRLQGWTDAQFEKTWERLAKVPRRIEYSD